MKQIEMFKKFCLPIILLSAVFLHSCDISDSNKSNATEELSDEELEVAGQIIAESLSDQKDGIFASLNDAFSLPSSSNFTSNSVEKGKYASSLYNTAMDKNSDNNANNYSYSYNPDSGTHLVHFSRSIREENFTKESTAELEYIYYDAEGAFIYSPRLDSDRIETIEYTGVRSGSIITPNKNSSYERNDEFLIEGLTSGGALTIEGLHEGSGQFEVTRENGDVIKRDYTLTVEFLNVQINSQTLSDGSLQKSVEGSLAYEMTISKNLNGSESLKTINGTIEFNGDGTALLRFQNILDDFKVTLEQGNLIGDNEFEGYVDSVDTESDPQRFTLSDDQTYLFGTDTEIDTDGDLTTLAGIQTALESNIRVESEGSFAENTDGALILQRVKFEYEENDLKFEDIVGSVDMETGSFTLENGNVFDITAETIFDKKGDLSKLENIGWALDNEYTIEAKGEFMPGDDGSNDVTNVKFEYDEKDFEFDGDVESADAEAGIFTLNDGNTYTILEGTTGFHKKSDYSTLDEVLTALSAGADVKAEGNYAPQSDGSLLVMKVKFESDQADDNGSDSPETDPFEGNVDSASAPDKTIEVSGVTYHILKDTEFDDNIQSLGNLVGALQRGDTIFVEGEFYNDGEKNIAVELEFEVDRKGNDEDDEDEEHDDFKFESNVSSVDVASNTFILSSGLTLMVNGDTRFDDDSNIRSLEDLKDALDNGDEVEAEGRYHSEGENNIVSKVEFDSDNHGDDDDGEDDDSDDDDDENHEERGFEGSVSSATSNSFILDGTTFTINDESRIQEKDGIESLQDVMNAIDDGDEVDAEGDYYVDGSDNIVIKVKFEVEHHDEGDDNGDDEDEDHEEQEFNGAVSSATSNSFILDGTTFTINDESRIQEKDGIESLQDVMDVIDAGDEVDAKGDYYVDGSNNIVVKVEFEVERDDSGDDEGEDDGEDDDEHHEKQKFNGTVSSATSTTFTLDGTTFTINDESRIQEKDGIESLQDVMDAIDAGDEVDAEGDYYVDGSNNIVVKVEFEVERNDSGDDEGEDDGEDDDEDHEKQEFNGAVSSATSTTFTLNGTTFTVNDNTKIKKKDGIESMQDVMDALDAGDEVDAEGDYYKDGSDNIVTKVKFEVERKDDGNDDGGGSDGDDEEDDD